MTYAKQLRENLGKLSADMHALINTAKAENNRGLTTEEATKFDKLQADYEAVNASIARAEKAESISVQLSAAPGDNVEVPLVAATGDKQESARTRAFYNYVRHGDRGLTSEDRQILATMSTTTGSQGGFVVPVTLSDQIETILKSYTGSEAYGRIATESGNPFNYPNVDDTGNIGEIVGQNAPVGAQDVAFGNAAFSSYIFSSKVVKTPEALLQDSAFDIPAMLASLLGIRIARIQNTKWAVGAGSGSNEPLGLITALVAATRTTPAAAAALLSFDDLLDLEHAVDPAYRSGARFMFNDPTLKVLKGIKDEALRPIWLPAAQSGMGGPLSTATIYGYPYVINVAMDSVAANKNSVVFGDLSKYLVRTVKGGTALKRFDELYGANLQVGFLATNRADGNLIATNACSVLVHPAS